MVLIKAWKERQAISPHRPRRVRTRWMVVVLAAVILATYMLGRIQ